MAGACQHEESQVKEIKRAMRWRGRARDARTRATPRAITRGKRRYTPYCFASSKLQMLMAEAKLLIALFMVTVSAAAHTRGEPPQASLRSARKRGAKHADERAAAGDGRGRVPPRSRAPPPRS